MKELLVLVATHKDYALPDDNVYFPIQVGKILSEQKLSFQGDETGDNISQKNKTFCELTALFWAWKNGLFQQYEYVGLNHYRRYFKGQGVHLKGKSIMSRQEILSQLEKHDGILGKKRNYYIESIYSHYKHAHHIQDLDVALEIIKERYPDYMESCRKVINGCTLHLYNMFIMRSDLVEQYCIWLFDILFDLEKRIDINDYSAYQQRVFGFIAERLFNIWLDKNEINTVSLPIAHIEPENMLKKAFKFLLRKIN
ncbi:DUF4422 domain-containing protein [Lonepinella sp. MS14435]|uniref:DUF4422 domain-containing protein n=1 Tax=unclassified Lonepinella TaxID=2642006 RepID=UPI0036D855EC